MKTIESQFSASNARSAGLTAKVLTLALFVCGSSFWAASAHAQQPLSYWSWEGTNGTPNVDGTWWHDKMGGGTAGRAAMRSVTDTVTRLELPSTGAGSAFPNPIPNINAGVSGGDVNLWGINTSAGSIRTFSSASAFAYNSFTIEGFFNASSVTGTQDLFQSRWGSNDQFRARVRDGELAMTLYNPSTGQFIDAATSNYNSTLSVAVNTDYYVAYAVSTGASAEDRFVDFYLKDLTNGGPLQHERMSIAAVFDSLFTGANLAMYVGPGSYSVVGDVRYSSGVMPQGDLIIIPEPGTIAAIMGGAILLFACVRRRLRRTA